MCLAIPLRITAIDGEMATVEMSGVMRQVSLALTPEANVGGYVLVHAGFAINVLDEVEARETLALFAALEEAGRRSAEEGDDSPADDDTPPSEPRPVSGPAPRGQAPGTDGSR